MTSKKVGGGGTGGAGSRPKKSASKKAKSSSTARSTAGTGALRLRSRSKDRMQTLSTGPSMARELRKARPPAPPQPSEDGGWSVASEAARGTATAIAAAALDKKADCVEILDVAGKVDYADFLVIMTGRSDRHAQALAQGIEEALRKKNLRPVAVEGLPHASWVLMDFGDVVVHVFQNEARQLYDIEGLWLDARRLPVPVPSTE